MAAAGGAEEVPEHFSCPVCFEVPESEVYQCLDGHVLCKKCYFQLTECPQCRIPLDTTRPIRNRYFEGLLDSIKVKCKYFIVCETKLPKGEMKHHEENCIYDFSKFGVFVRLCKLMGHSDCDFQINNGNTEKAVQHFVSTHKCFLFEGAKYKVTLEDLPLNPASEEIQFWTPIISNLSDNQCYIFTMAVLDSKKGSMTWLSFYLPYPGNSKRSESPFKILFKHLYGDTNEPFMSTMLMTPVPISKADFYLPFNVPSPFQLSWLKSHSLLKNSVSFEYEIIPKGGSGNDAGSYQIVQCTKYSSFPKVLPVEEGKVVFWNRMERSPAAQELLDEELAWEKNKDRGTIFTFIKKVLEGEFEAFPGIVNGDMEWLKYGCYFLAARYGTVNAMQYILNKGLNCNVVSDNSGTPLHWTMYDPNKKIGLRKAKLLVEQGGADPKMISKFDKQTLLHSAARYGTPESVKYFLNLGLDVNQVDELGRTPFQTLVELRVYPGEEDELCLKMAKILLDSGTDCDIKTESDLSVSEFAQLTRLEKIQDLILSAQSVKAS